MMSVSLLGGSRTEEARALRWSDVDLEAGTVSVVRSVRLSGETKTKESRRAVQLFVVAVEALKELVLKQALFTETLASLPLGCHNLYSNPE